MVKTFLVPAALVGEVLRKLANTHNSAPFAGHAAGSLFLERISGERLSDSVGLWKLRFDFGPAWPALRFFDWKTGEAKEVAMFDMADWSILDVFLED